MKKLAGLVLCGLAAASCYGFGSKQPSPNPEAVPAIPTPVKPKGPVRMICDKTCTEKEKSKVADAEALINIFRSAPCALAQLKSVKLVQTNGQTAEEVFRDIAERSAEVTVTYYRSDNGVIGYRNKGSTTIHFNRKFHDRYGSWETASNGLHEISHTWGYAHDFDRTARRPYSVPYQMNRLTERCQKEAS